MDHLRRESASRASTWTGLTGLLNQAALARRVEEPAEFDGVVAVCDMDNFKDVNDRYGHLVGDEILRNIGHLLQSSIRHEDEAFRWGGDEFVILFRNQRPEVARKRMSGHRSPPARFPRARSRGAAHLLQLGNRRCPRPRAARGAGRGRPEHVCAQARTRRERFREAPAGGVGQGRVGSFRLSIRAKLVARGH